MTLFVLPLPWGVDELLLGRTGPVSLSWVCLVLGFFFPEFFLCFQLQKAIEGSTRSGVRLRPPLASFRDINRTSTNPKVGQDTQAWSRDDSGMVAAQPAANLGTESPLPPCSHSPQPSHSQEEGEVPSSACATDTELEEMELTGPVAENISDILKDMNLYTTDLDEDEDEDVPL